MRLAARLAERCGIARRAARSVAPGPAGPGFHTSRSEGSRVWSGVLRDVWREPLGWAAGRLGRGIWAGLGRGLWRGSGVGLGRGVWRGVETGCGVARRDGVRVSGGVCGVVRRGSPSRVAGCFRDAWRDFRCTKNGTKMGVWRRFLTRFSFSIAILFV